MKKFFYLAAALVLMAGCAKDKNPAQPEEHFTMRMVGRDIYELAESESVRPEIWDYNAAGRISKSILRDTEDGTDRTLERVTYGLDKIIVNDYLGKTLAEIQMNEKMRPAQMFVEESGMQVSTSFRYDEEHLTGFSLMSKQTVIPYLSRAVMDNSSIQEYELTWEDGNLVEMVSDWSGSQPDDYRTRFVFGYDPELENCYNIDITMMLLSEMVPAFRPLLLTRLFTYCDYGQMNRNMINHLRVVRESRDGDAALAEGYTVDYLQVEKGVVSLIGLKRSSVESRAVPSTGLYDYDFRVAFTYDKIKK